MQSLTTVAANRPGPVAEHAGVRLAQVDNRVPMASPDDGPGRATIEPEKKPPQADSVTPRLSAIVITDRNMRPRKPDAAARWSNEVDHAFSRASWAMSIQLNTSPTMLGTSPYRCRGR